MGGLPPPPPGVAGMAQTVDELDHAGAHNEPFSRMGLLDKPLILCDSLSAQSWQRSANRRQCGRPGGRGRSPRGLDGERGDAEACRLSDARPRRAQVACGSVRGDDALSTQIHLLVPAYAASYAPAGSRLTHHKGRLRIHASLHACANLPIILAQGTFLLMPLRPELWNYPFSKAQAPE